MTSHFHVHSRPLTALLLLEVTPGYAVVVAPCHAPRCQATKEMAKSGSGHSPTNRQASFDLDRMAIPGYTDRANGLRREMLKD